MTKKCPEFITHIRRYVNLNEQDVVKIESFVHPLEITKREYLLKEGEVCKSNFFVESGCLRMFFNNEKMDEKTIQFAIENWWLADYFSYARQTPSEYSIQAVEKSFIVALDYHSQDELFNEVPQLEKYFRIMMQRALSASQLRVKLIYELSKEEMYTLFSTSYPQFFQRVPQYMIASYLGLTPEYLSELRKRR